MLRKILVGLPVHFELIVAEHLPIPLLECLSWYALEDQMSLRMKWQNEIE